jgi:hypothetical protein
MMVRRLSIALVVVSGLCLLGLARTGANPAESQLADPVYLSEDVQQPGGNHDTASHRFRGNQSHHWRQVMIAQH